MSRVCVCEQTAPRPQVLSQRAALSQRLSQLAHLGRGSLRDGRRGFLCAQAAAAAAQVTLLAYAPGSRQIAFVYSLST